MFFRCYICLIFVYILIFLFLGFFGCLCFFELYCLLLVVFLVVGQWGGIDIVIDPFTAARKAEIIMTLNAWNDVKVVEPKSFAAIVDVIA